jgi:hypothetical protein
MVHQKIPRYIPMNEAKYVMKMWNAPKQINTLSNCGDSSVWIWRAAFAMARS